MTGFVAVVRWDGDLARALDGAKEICDVAPYRIGRIGRAGRTGPVFGTAADEVAVAVAVGGSERFTSPSLDVVGDLRLDDEDALARELGCPDLRGVALVARAHERWGTELARHLVGDFAIVLVDRARRAVFAARDRFGVKPLAYRVLDRAIAFASEPGALARWERRDAVDEETIARYLEGNAPTMERTFFRSVSRLAPRHVLRATPAGVSSGSYWSPPTLPQPRSRNDSLDAFREAFRTAVARRCPVGEPTLVHASGGLDSSAVAVVARDLPDRSPHFVSTYTAEADERSYVSALTNRLGHVHVVDARATADLDDPLDPSEPTRFALAESSTAIAQIAREVNARIHLTGIGGDELLFERGICRDLARAGRFIAMVREAMLAPRYSSQSTRFYVRDALRHLVPPSWDGVIARVRPPRPRPRPAHLRRDRFTSPQVARALARSRPPSDTTQFNADWITGSSLVWTLESEERWHARNGFEVRHPFLDEQLVATVLSIPWEQRIPGGRMKVVLRDGLGDRLPRVIRERSGITGFNDAWAVAVRAKLEHVRAPIEGGPWLADAWVERTTARALLERFIDDPTESELARTVWDIAMLEHWLRAVT